MVEKGVPRPTGYFFREKRLRKEAESKKHQSTPTVMCKPVVTYIYRPLFFLFIIWGPFYFYTVYSVKATLSVTVLYLVAEILAYVLNIIFFFNFFFTVERNKVSLRSLQPRFAEKDWPDVDICFTHHSEEIEPMLRSSLMAAIGLDYPREKMHIKVLDDGYLEQRASGEHEVTALGKELEALIQDIVGEDVHPHRMKVAGHLVPRRHAAPRGFLMVTYSDESGHFPVISIIARTKGPRDFFRTGNIENAIYNAATTNRFIAIFDADAQPHKDFLQRTLPLFFTHDAGAGRYAPDWTTAFVQTPQRFRNVLEAFGPDDPLYQSNGIFHGAVQTGRDGLGLAAYSGTNAVFFKPALDDCLGIVYGVLSEDAATGMKMHNFGWQGKYLHAHLATGECKTTIGEALGVRKRRAVGAFQMFLMALNWRWLFHHKFLGPPLGMQSAARLKGLREDPQLFAVPIEPDDTGVAERRRRRESWGLWFARTVIFVDTTVSPISSVGVAFMLYAVAMLFLYADQPPVHFFKPGPIRWDEGLYRLASVAVYQGLRLLTLSVGCHVVFMDGSAGQDVWRHFQAFFVYAWVTLLGTLEALVIAMRGKGARWLPERAGRTSFLLEGPNVLVLLSLLVGMGVAVANALTDVTTPKRNSFRSVGAILCGQLVVSCIWPVTRCSIANFVRLPAWSFKVPKFVLMSSGVVVGIAIIAILGRKAQPLPNVGSFERADYPNVFARYQKNTTIWGRLELSYQSIFKAQDGIFLPNARTLDFKDGGYILDYDTNLVSSLYTGYAMMVAVQMDKKKDFHQMWTWAKRTLLLQPPSLFAGYFASQVTPAGVVVTETPTPEAEEYIATALLFAGARWQPRGPDVFGDFREDAHQILQTLLYKQRFAGGIIGNVTNMFSNATHLVPALPLLSSQSYVSTAAQTVGFYEVWARFVPGRYGGGEEGPWHAAREKGREVLRLASTTDSGLPPRLASIAGTPFAGPEGTGAEWDSEAWRSIPNFAIDAIWWDRAEWEKDHSAKFLRFLKTEGMKFYGVRYNLKGNLLEAGTSEPKRDGLVSINIIPAVAVSNYVDIRLFVDQIWSIQAPIPGARRTYSNLLYMMGMLTASGRYRVYDPTYGSGTS